jgi:hypothetical protein
LKKSAGNRLFCIQLFNLVFVFVKHDAPLELHGLRQHAVFQRKGLFDKDKFSGNFIAAVSGFQ